MKAQLLIIAALPWLCCAGCDNLAKGTRLKPEEQSQFFDNGTSARVPPPHSIARGDLRADSLLYSGRDSDGRVATQFPWPINRAVLARGQQQYLAICANCHGSDGYGHGIIVQRGFPEPPSLHNKSLTNAPVGHFFQVMTNGYGAMFPYANIVSANDRWAIAAYIRALQRSQHGNAQDVPPDKLAQLNQEPAP